ncbi:DUF4446 family protein [Paenibacillus sp. GCM10023252]|uniref:DUF4446 family protein n=1 Tax=Paenibacillus sp. GCM10023252 TaxID=3252649 RepID=UPI003622EC06
MNDIITSPMDLITIALTALLFIAFLWLIVLGRKLSRLRKQYMQAMDSTGVTNLEEIIIGLRTSLNEQEEQLRRQQGELTVLASEQRQAKSRVGINRYNAFSDRGSDLSFSIAIMNEAKDGVVLSGIHNRDNTYVYAKPVEKGTSSYALTPEELKAIQEAK